MTAVHDAIAAGIAALTPVAHTAPADLGYGTDLDCRSDLAADAGDVSGLSCLQQDIFHWCITEPGALPDEDPEAKAWGLGAFGLLHRGLTQKDLTNLERKATSGLLALDDRISEAECVITFDGTTLRMALTITPAYEQQSFDLIVYLKSDGSSSAEIA